VDISITREALATVASVLSILGVVYSILRSHFVVEFKVNTMWRLLFESAIEGALKKGILQTHSPMRLDAKIAAYLAGSEIGASLKAFYERRGLAAKDDASARWALYVEFRYDWEDKVCKPTGLNQTEALIAALQFCKDGQPDA